MRSPLSVMCWTPRLRDAPRNHEPCTKKFYTTVTQSAPCIMAIAIGATFDDTAGARNATEPLAHAPQRNTAPKSYISAGNLLDIVAQIVITDRGGSRSYCWSMQSRCSGQLYFMMSCLSTVNRPYKA